MKTLQVVRGFPPAVQLLLINQFGVDVGFYLLIPFLAAYLGHDLGMSAALVGLVLGLRNLSQQGLFILGGSAADRLGPRTVIIAGCGLRTVGFGLFAIGSSFPVVLVAAGLSGLAGALFYPAVRTYLARASDGGAAESFALLNVFATSGSLVGLLLGGLLVLVDFRCCALVAAAVFALLTVAQLFALPAYRATERQGSVRADWREVFGNRRFLVFAIAAAGMATLENQLYLLLPEGARRASGREESVSVLLVVGALINMGLQLRVTRAVERRGGGTRWVGLGLTLMACGFVPPMFVRGQVPPAGPVEAALHTLPVLAGALLLYCGVMIAQPPVIGLIPRFGREGLTGTYFGVFSMFSGLAAAAGNALVGWAMDTGWRTGHEALPWGCCVFFGVASAVAVAWLYRTGALPGPTALDETGSCPGAGRVPRPAHAFDEEANRPH
ncbi:MFS transporter [Streptomyces niger]|uniref:MFS transporter n=1 Tax=Streptomyces niger TaxID=66373 RepID=UPI000DA619A7|nr:MFS transporter [Streptomyces niger]